MAVVGALPARATVQNDAKVYLVVVTEEQGPPTLLPSPPLHQQASEQETLPQPRDQGHHHKIRQQYPVGAAAASTGSVHFHAGVYNCPNIPSNSSSRGATTSTTGTTSMDGRTGVPTHSAYSTIAGQEPSMNLALPLVAPTFHQPLYNMCVDVPFITFSNGQQQIQGMYQNIGQFPSSNYSHNLDLMHPNHIRRSLGYGTQLPTALHTAACSGNMHKLCAHLDLSLLYYYLTTWMILWLKSLITP